MECKLKKWLYLKSELVCPIFEYNVISFSLRSVNDRMIVIVDSSARERAIWVAFKETVAPLSPNQVRILTQDDARKDSKFGYVIEYEN